jgi:hypothetical protein
VISSKLSTAEVLYAQNCIHLIHEFVQKHNILFTTYSGNSIETAKRLKNSQLYTLIIIIILVVVVVEAAATAVVMVAVAVVAEIEVVVVVVIAVVVVVVVVLVMAVVVVGGGRIVKTTPFCSQNLKCTDIIHIQKLRIPYYFTWKLLLVTSTWFM